MRLSPLLSGADSGLSQIPSVAAMTLVEVTLEKGRSLGCELPWKPEPLLCRARGNLCWGSGEEALSGLYLLGRRSQQQASVALGFI